MSNPKKEAASKAINRTITIVEDALGINVPRSSVPSISRETMVEMLKAGFRTPLVGCWCNQFVGWGSPVKLKGTKRSPVRVEFVPGFGKAGSGGAAITPELEMSEFERMVDEVAKRLRNGRLVDWGGSGWSDDYIRFFIMTLNKIYREEIPSSKNRWNVQSPSGWKVFYVLGRDDIEDTHTMGRIATAIKTGKRIIDITGSTPDDLTGYYKSAVNKRKLASVARGKPTRTRQDASRGGGRGSAGALRRSRKGKPTRTRQDAKNEPVVWGQSR